MPDASKVSNSGFKGGTALGKIYFPHYRYSEDLDFTLRKPMNGNDIRGSLESAFEYLGKEYNADFRIRDFDSKSYFTDAKAQFVGLKGQKNTIAIDLSPDEILVDEIMPKKVFNPYYEKEFSVYAYSLEEIIAEKLRSILQRTRVRDYYDAWYLLTKARRKIDEEKLREIFHKKAERKKLAFTNAEQFLDKDKLEQAKAYYEPQIKNQLKNLPPFDKMAKELENAILALKLEWPTASQTDPLVRVPRLFLR